MLNQPKFERPEFDTDADGNPISDTATAGVPTTIRVSKATKEKEASDERFGDAVKSFAGNFMAGIAAGMASSRNETARTSGVAMQRAMKVFDVTQDTKLGEERGMASARVSAFGVAEQKKKIFEEDARQLTTYKAGASQSFESKIPTRVASLIEFDKGFGERMRAEQKLREEYTSKKLRGEVTF